MSTREMDRKAVIREELIGVFRRRKTEKGDGGFITVSRRKVAGIVETPPESIATVLTDSYDFDVEVPMVMKDMGLVVVAGSVRTVRRSGSTYFEFSATEPS